MHVLSHSANVSFKKYVGKMRWVDEVPILSIFSVKNKNVHVEVEVEVGRGSKKAKVMST